MKRAIGTKWECGGPHPPDELWWVWIEASSIGGSQPEDPPEHPDTRLFKAPEFVAKAIVAEHNALIDLAYTFTVVRDADNDCKSDGLERQLSDVARAHLSPKHDAFEQAHDELVGKVL